MIKFLQNLFRKALLLSSKMKRAVIILFCLLKCCTLQYISDLYSTHWRGYVVPLNLTSYVTPVVSMFICADLCTSRAMECLTFSVTSFTGSEAAGAMECRLSRRSGFSSEFVTEVEAGAILFTSNTILY